MTPSAVAGVASLVDAGVASLADLAGGVTVCVASLAYAGGGVHGRCRGGVSG